MRSNEIGAFSFEEQKTIWQFNTGQEGLFIAKMVKMFSGDDFITDYNYSIRNIGILYMTTMAGNLFQIDLKTGIPLTDKGRFKGKGNNKGLLSTLSFEDGISYWFSISR